MRSLYRYRNSGRRSNESTSSAFKVFIAYEDAAAERRSMALLKRMSSALGCPADEWLQVTMWNFGEDEFPPKITIHEAAQAGVVFVAAREQDAVPTALAEWIKCWLIKRSDTPCALVALLELHGKNPEDRRGILAHLEQVARTQDLVFFAELSERDSASTSSRIPPEFHVFQDDGRGASQSELLRNQPEQEEEL